MKKHFFVVLALVFTTVNAADCTIKVDNVGEPNSVAAYTVINPMIEYSDLDTLDARQVINSSGTVMLDEQGGYDFDIYISPYPDMPPVVTDFAEATFVLRVRAKGGDLFSIPFTYFAPTQIENVQQALGNAEDKQSIATIISNKINVELLGLIYFDFEQSDYSLIAETLVNSDKSIEAVNRALILHAFNNSVWKIDAWLNPSDENSQAVAILQINENLVEVYASLSETAKAFLQTRADKAVLETFEQMQVWMEEEILISALNHSDNFTEVFSLISANISYFSELNYGAYNLLSNAKKSTVASEFIKQTQSKKNNIKDICGSLNTLIANASTSTVTSGGGGSGSGGGGGSRIASNSIDISAPLTTDVAEATPPIASSFDDLSQVPWAETAINYLEYMGAINGKAHRIFAPLDPVKREEFLKIILEATKMTDNKASCGFKDTGPEFWHFPYISTAVTLGVTNGVSETEFGVGEPITRQDMAVFAKRIADIKGIGLVKTREISFVDSGEFASYAIEAIRILAEAGIINGDTEGFFFPTGIANRAQAAKIIYELCTLPSSLTGGF